MVCRPHLPKYARTKKLPIRDGVSLQGRYQRNARLHLPCIMSLFVCAKSPNQQRMIFSSSTILPGRVDHFYLMTIVTNFNVGNRLPCTNKAAGVS